MDYQSRRRSVHLSQFRQPNTLRSLVDLDWRCTTSNGNPILSSATLRLPFQAPTEPSIPPSSPSLGPPSAIGIAQPHATTASTFLTALSSPSINNCTWPPFHLGPCVPHLQGLQVNLPDTNCLRRDTIPQAVIAQCTCRLHSALYSSVQRLGGQVSTRYPHRIQLHSSRNSTAP